MFDRNGYCLTINVLLSDYMQMVKLTRNKQKTT